MDCMVKPNAGAAGCSAVHGLSRTTLLTRDQAGWQHASLACYIERVERVWVGSHR